MWSHFIRALPMTLATMVLTAVAVLAATGTTDSPDTPANTLSYTLEDIFNRIDTGTLGSQSAFTEPSVPPGTGTMHTLNEIMELLKSTYTRVPKTWNLECYNASGTIISCTGTGQDGEYQLGVRPRYYPQVGTPGAYPPYGWGGPRFTDNGDGTVSDNFTGLVWLKDANCAGTAVDWETALSYSNALFDGCTNCFGTTGDCGLSDGSSAGDWRLPNANELYSLIDSSKNDPALPAGYPFTGVAPSPPISFYWSSSTPGLVQENAFCVYIEGGAMNHCLKINTYWAWPVSGGY
jgi:hypothetical protein